MSARIVLAISPWHDAMPFSGKDFDGYLYIPNAIRHRRPWSVQANPVV
jgi:hypothetical protein